MSDIRGSLRVKAGGEEYTLFVGMSVLADLQDKHGQDVLEKIDPPEGASESWMPDLNIVTDLFMGALQRFHKEVADRWIVDDIIAENADALPQLMGAGFPDAKSSTKPGKPRSRKKATA